jgi:hypothetical protein
MTSIPNATATLDRTAVRAYAAAPRWAVLAAWAVVVCDVPSALWRVTVPGWYPVFLTVLSLVLAHLTVGLVQPWGERIPRWVPGIGGRPLNTRAVYRAAVAGATSILALTTYFLLNHTFHFVGHGWVAIGHTKSTVSAPGWDILRWYVPLLAWGPLLLLVAADYRRRTFGASR